MKVKELLADLSEMNPEAEVNVQASEGCHGPGPTYEIYSTEYWEANEKYQTPATAFIEIGDGCFCDGHRGSKMKKLGLGPQNISQFYLGLEAAVKVVEEKLKWYDDAIAKLAKPQDIEEKLEKERYGQAKRALETTLRDLGKLQNRGEKLRKVGDIMQDMEELLFELHVDHDMQHGEVLYLINGWQKIHVPGQIETYTDDNSNPVLYGPKKKRRSMREISEDIKRNNRRK